MFKWVARALRQPRLPERQANYLKGNEQGRTEALFVSAGMLSQYSHESTDPDYQDGFLDALDGRCKPPAI